MLRRTNAQENQRSPRREAFAQHVEQVVDQFLLHMIVSHRDKTNSFSFQFYCGDRKRVEMNQLFQSVFLEPEHLKVEAHVEAHDYWE